MTCHQYADEHFDCVEKLPGRPALLESAHHYWAIAQSVINAPQRRQPAIIAYASCTRTLPALRNIVTCAVQ